MRPDQVLQALPGLPAAAERRAYEGQSAVPLKPQMLTAALALLLIDVVAILLLQSGGFGGIAAALRRGRARLATIALLIVGLGFVASMIAAGPAIAQTNVRPGTPTQNLPPDLAQALKATAKVTFAYVLTGDPATDEASRQGLNGLDRVLIIRTAVDPGEPEAVNIETQEIAFYPLLYWPVLPNAKPLSDRALAKIDAYMKQGGMIIFDTRDYGQGLPSGMGVQSSDGTALSRLLGRLDIPRLEPVPENHVLTKSFYLIRAFPGRWDGGQLWLEAGEQDGVENKRARHSDGVSSILVTSNDFAAAWALDDRGRGVYPVVPGGEVQREQAFRAGINIVMYALTGNYKSDQVHVPALLERLGQ